MNNNHRFDRASRPVAAWAAAALALASVALNASAAVTDVSATPLITEAPNAVKPNIMFVLDDSGSMDRDYMPDDAGFSSDKYGRYASQCNGLAYNPAITYTVPVDSTGTNMAAGTFTFPTSGTQPYYYTYNTYTGAPKALSYSYSTGSLDTSSTFYRECNSTEGSSPGFGRFTKVTVTATSPDLQNYRNWYTYYRTRMLMMRTAASQAFKGISDKYRVGFSTISSTVVDGSKFLDTSDFDATQKSTWYSRLFGSNPNSYTPLRGAVSKAGKYFAKRGTRGDGSAQTFDPVQFSCQKNFTILTTDGYWNDPTETSTYGPYRLDGSNVGQQDASAPRPMRDSGIETYSVTTPMQQLVHWYRTRQQTQRTTESYTEYQLTRCGGGGRKVLEQSTVSRYRDATNTETSYYRNTQTYNSVVTYTSGTPGTAVKQNIVNGAYTSEGTTTTSGFTGGSLNAPDASDTTSIRSAECLPPAPTWTPNLRAP